VADQGNRRSSTRFRPIGRFGGLVPPPNWTRTMVSARSQPIDGTKQRLRDPRIGSPFMFRVAPPDTLLDALLGRGQADTQGVFDPILREQFLAAERQLEFVRNTPGATDADVAEAAQALLGGRSPAPGQNIGIIDAAVQSTNNYGAQVARRREFTQSNFFATGPTRGATLRRLQKFVAANGIQFDPAKAPQTQANQAAVSDLTQALDVIVQLNRMVVTPALTLLVNPETLNITYARKQSYQDRSRYNYIFQSWGQEQVRLSVSGKSAGFVVGNLGQTVPGQLVGDPEVLDIDPFYTSSVSGYQYASKLDSAAWQNLMSLFSFYRHNGYIYDNSQQPRSEAHLFVGHIEISYDQFVYLGQFENFQYGYTENKQHGAVEFSFDFVASYMYDNSQSGPVESLEAPTPSPSAATRGGTPFIPRVSTTISQSQDPTGSTAVLDPVIDPVSSIGLLGRDRFSEDAF
jgi:hypothetical protein